MEITRSYATDNTSMDIVITDGELRLKAGYHSYIADGTRYHVVSYILIKNRELDADIFEADTTEFDCTTQLLRRMTRAIVYAKQERQDITHLPKAMQLYMTLFSEVVMVSGIE